MAISRSQMKRQLYMGGGITQLPMNQMMVPRGEYGLGSIVKSVKKAVKGAAGAVKDFASSDVGKMALMAAGAYYAPAMFGGTVGFGPASTYGSFARGLMSPNLIGPMTKAGSLGRTISSAVTGGGVSGLLTGKSGMALSAIGGGLLGSIFGSPEKAAEMYAQNPEKVQSYLAQYYKNINQDATEEEVQQFVSSQTSGLAAGQYGSFAKGGRVGFEEGGTFLTMEEAAKRNPTMFMDTTTYNPIPEDADREAATEIARTMMAVRSLPREDGEIEDTETMSTKDFMINEYFIPKRKELMENYGLSLEEANNLIKEAVSQIRDKTVERDKKGLGGLISKMINNNPEIFKKLQMSSPVRQLQAKYMMNLNPKMDEEEVIDYIRENAAYGGPMGEVRENQARYKRTRL
jgi:hypothetical protein